MEPRTSIGDAEKEGAKNKNNGDRTGKSNGGKENQGGTRDRSRASKTRKCVSTKKNS